MLLSGVRLRSIRGQRTEGIGLDSWQGQADTGRGQRLEKFFMLPQMLHRF